MAQDTSVQAIRSCLDCGEVKPTSEFHKDGWRKDGYKPYCKPCYGIRGKRYNATSKERDPERWRSRRRHAELRTNYGISLEQYNALFAEQDGLCAICHKPFVKVDHRSHFDVEHDHRTGAVRGLVHNRCNRILSAADDDVEILRAAIDYLERHA